MQAISDNPQQNSAQRDQTLRHIAVVGAGLAGLMTAKVLNKLGHQVTVFDKGRGPGGRVCSRRRTLNGGEELIFDHGAPAFLIRSPLLKHWCEEWHRQGVLQDWYPRVETTVLCSDEPVWVARDRMSRLGRYLGQGLDLRLNTRVGDAQRKNNQWQLRDIYGQNLEGTVQKTFDDLLVATPAQQALPFLKSSSAWTTLAEGVLYEPCWAVMVAFHQHWEMEADVVKFSDDVMDFAVRNASKTGRTQEETWTLYANVAWSAKHLEHPAPVVAEQVLACFQRLLNRGPLQVRSLEAHRWRYARPYLGQRPKQFYDHQRGLGICGDWTQWSNRLAGGVEAALLSGLELSNQYTSTYNTHGGMGDKHNDGITVTQGG